MKKLLVLLVFVFVVIFSTMVYASDFTLKVSGFQNLDMNYSPPYYGITYVNLPSNSVDLLDSFCVDTGHYISSGPIYNGWYVPITDDGKREAAWVFNSYDQYAHNGYFWNNVNYSATQAGTAMQLAIWSLTGQSVPQSNIPLNQRNYQSVWNLASYFKNNADTFKQTNYQDLLNIASGYSTLSLYDLNGNKAQDLMASTPVPEPGSIWLLGSGLIGLLGVGRKRKV